MIPNQTLWAVTDPNWGEPIIIPETVRAGEDAAKDAVLWMVEFGLYHGGSEIASIKGNWEKLFGHGFRVARVSNFTVDIQESTL